MVPLFKPPFHHFVKKQRKPLKLAIHDAVEAIWENPQAGELKVGDLAGFRVYKFKFDGQTYLTSCRKIGNSLVFYMIGSHENFYGKLKRYIKEVE